ncbi:hypothetical protein ABZP36_002086 [Zizania latifolia]
MCLPLKTWRAATAVHGDGGLWVPTLSSSPFDFSPEKAKYTAAPAAVDGDVRLLVPTMLPPFTFSPKSIMSTYFTFSPETTASSPFNLSPKTTISSPLTFSPEKVPALEVDFGRGMTPPFLALGNVVVRSVWAHNLAEEFELIESLLPRFRYVAVDTEFPGTVHRPDVPAYLLSSAEQYKLIKANVDNLHLVQLGLTLFDDDDRLPDFGTGGAVQVVWEFNFREFDVLHHPHAPESIAMLRKKGVDFSRTRRHGVDAAAFGARLRKWLRAGLGRAGVITFSGNYDLAYMLKTMYGGGYKLPTTAAQFENVAKSAVGKMLYDVKEMARHCPSDLRGGLELVAGKLGVRRVVGEAHQAGSDSLLTCQTFIKMRECYFGDGKLTNVAGMITGMTACC